MATSYVSSDGRVTIPEEILVFLGLERGGQVEFVHLMAGQVTMIPRNLPANSLKGILPKADVDCSIEEMVEIAGRRAAMAAK